MPIPAPSIQPFGEPSAFVPMLAEDRPCIVCFANSANQSPPHNPRDVGPPPNVVTVCDLTAYGVPAEASAVNLSGILIITPNWRIQQATAEVWVSFRPWGGTMAMDWYTMQVIEADVSGGVRSTAGRTIPLGSGKFEWMWHGTPYGRYAEGYPGLGLNLSMTGYYVPLRVVLPGLLGNGGPN